MAESIQIFMEKDRLQPLADNIKVLKGADNITLQQMEDTIAETNTDIVSQTDLIAQLTSALQGKSVPGGGGVETCTVVLDIRGYNNGYAYTVYENGAITSNVTAAYDIPAQTLTLNNVMCGTFVYLYPSFPMPRSTITGGAQEYTVSGTLVYKIASAPNTTVNIKVYSDA